jgi:hypothetical protein
MTDPAPDHLKAMAKLYDKAIDSEVTSHALDFLCRAQLLLDIASDDPETAKSFIHTDAGRAAALREYKELTDDDREELHKAISQHWSLNLNLAVRKLWHDAHVLGFQPDSLDPKHVAMTAATYLSRTPRDVLNEMTKPSDSTHS